MNLPDAFLARMKSQLGGEYAAFIAQYDMPPVRGMRINTLKLSKDEFLGICPWRTEQAETLDEGLILNDEIERISLNPYHIAGLFYMQEPSAMSVIEHAEICPGMRVLDLCAAPGGKSGGIAARLKGEGLLIANEIIPSRARILCQNLERLGVMNAIITNAHPMDFAKAAPGYFDRVIVDAPCSGEGMFRKDVAAVSEWSPESVVSCAARQKAILESAAELVSPGGKLIYSTCTFSPDEDEGVIEDFLRNHAEFELELIKRYYPHTCRCEGHFVARLINRSDECHKLLKPFRPCNDKSSLKLINDFTKTTFKSFPERGEYHIGRIGNVSYLPFSFPEGISKLRIMAMGVAMGQLVKNRFKPAHSLFMASGATNELNFECVNNLDFECDAPELRRFLSGNTLNIPEALSGFVNVTVSGFPIGFGKAVGGVLKNHLPKGLEVAAFRL